ncbi:hypothetical protein CVT26_014734 [Gymnopilus dilepis]|uniref:Uncharacterized protein n=1 Tax=Gymnopilus dilepis TaxID=231916 RepID=A0A409W3M8_9AGAR|nr:hypothetical protein CVT26_014734 [Gymnopilus dilepis]
MKFTFSWPAVSFAQRKDGDADVDMDKHRDPTERTAKALFKGRKRRGRPINANVTLDIKSRELWKKILAPHPPQPAQDKFATAKAQLEESKLGVEDMRERVNALLGMVIRSPKAKRKRRGREEEEGEEKEERKFTFRAPIAFPNPFVNTATSASTPKKKITGSAPDSPPRKHVRKHSNERNPDRNPDSNSNTDLNLPSNLKRASGTAQPEPMDAMRKWRTQKKEKTKRRKEMRRVKEFFLVGLEERGMEDREMGDVFGEREGLGFSFGAKGKGRARAREDETFDSDMQDSEDSDSDMEGVVEPARPLSGSDLTSWR